MKEGGGVGIDGPFSVGCRIVLRGSVMSNHYFFYRLKLVIDVRFARVTYLPVDVSDFYPFVAVFAYDDFMVAADRLKINHHVLRDTLGERLVGGKRDANPL